jgi:hypothetical protein
MDARIQNGARVYLRNCICGEPGMVSGFDRAGRALVFWPDMPEFHRWTAHSLDSLIVDETFTVRQLDLFQFAQVAA